MFGLGGPFSNAAMRNSTTAGNVGAGYGSTASTVNANLLPFLTRNLNSPTGFTQAQRGNMLTAAEAGTGGSTAGITTEANLMAARNRNPAALSGALAEAARQKDKANAGVAEGIEAKNADVQMQQQQNAEEGLQKLGATDTDAQLKAMGLQNDDLKTAADTYGKGSWLSDLSSIVGTAGKIGSSFFPGGMAGKVFGGLAKV